MCQRVACTSLVDAAVTRASHPFHHLPRVNKDHADRHLPHLEKVSACVLVFDRFHMCPSLNKVQLCSCFCVLFL